MAEVSQIVDYVVFSALIVGSLAVGLFNSRKQKTTDEYVHGSRKMSLLPVSVSLFVSFLSAMTMQGVPAEVYVHGLDVAFTMLAVTGAGLVIFTFLPIYYDLKPSSVYQYLELRFGSNKPRILASIVSQINKVAYCGLVTYGPAVALESFINIPVNYGIILLTVVCTLYTSLGGLRGVIWTDMFQALIIVVAFVLVVVMGLANLGMSTIWSELQSHGRTNINFSFDVTVRNSFWISVFCVSIQWFYLFSLQTAVMRYTSLPTKKLAILSVILGSTGCMLLIFLAVAAGAVVFAHYAHLGCGPLASKHISSSNQVVPYYVVTVLNYPGVPGLFLAAIVASSLSSISSIQNAISVLCWTDILSKLMPKLSDWQKTLVLKSIVALVGLISLAVAFLAKNSGETIYNLGFAILDMVLAPTFGMFVLGALVPFASTIGAIVGCIVSVVLLGWISIGRLLYGGNRASPATYLNETCYDIPSNFSSMSLNHLQQQQEGDYSFMENTTPLSYSNHTASDTLWVYNISSYTNPILGISLTFIVGALVSIIPAFRQKEPFDEKLLFPVIRALLKWRRGGDSETVKSLELKDSEKTLI